MILAGLILLALYLEEKLGSKIPTYTAIGLDACGLGLTAWSAIKNSKEKYFPTKAKAFEE